MKKLALALAALAVALPATAQQTRDEGRAKFGLGVSIAPIEALGARLGVGGSRTIDLYAPIQLGPQLRIEPSIGILSVDRPSGSTDERDIALGIGVFLLQRAGGPVDIYMGGRLKLNFAHVEADLPGGGTASDSGTDLSLAAALGGEYYLAPRFSLGLEGQLGFYSNSDVSGDDSGVFTNGLAFLRVYF